ncbi:MULTISPECIES: ZIP family metal transporter [Methylotuvimicrobium]|uniref:Zinc/iron permease n=2 Tax=Methylotuvimicrobium TaxID=2822410 RepID=G4T2N6_META2|nr:MULTISPECIES: ZIP family metal transporter [Methylotuvimicrobium]QCW83739.1 ZIP family metal transporter [Methylotuvimicrobium buryatense]CCE22520.1 Zinc/iron permease [Methylotuvimicrobium alcaliphilum 20Z]
MPISAEVIFYTLSASLLVSLVSLSGAFVFYLDRQLLKRLLPYLIALAVGVLLGDAFIHLIPDAAERQGSIATVCLTTLAGVFLFFVLEKIVRWRHDHTVFADDSIKPMAKMNLMGDAVHNFVDGILIGGSFLVDPVIGLTTTLAIVVHEIPQEIGDVGALVYGGYSPKDAVLYNFYCSLTVVMGAVFTLLLGQFAEASLILLLPIAAGGFIYIAATDFIPVLHEHSSLRNLCGQSFVFALGIGFMQAIVVLEGNLLMP